MKKGNERRNFDELVWVGGGMWINKSFGEGEVYSMYQPRKERKETKKEEFWKPNVAECTAAKPD